MIKNQFVYVSWNTKNKKHLIDKGYVFTKLGDRIQIRVFDLQESSGVKIELICDYCGEPYDKAYSHYTKSNKSIVNKDCCKNCTNKKTNEIVKIKYGVDNPFQMESTKEKIKQTNTEKYGVENYTQTDEYKQKMIDTNRKKYGKDYYTQTEEFKERFEKTNLQKYGVKNPAMLTEVQEKMKRTTFDKYGVEFYVQTDEYKEKTTQSSLEKYGVNHHTQSEEVKNKMKQTNLQKYGVEYYSQTKESVLKHKATLQEKYGVDNISQIPEVKIKKAESFYKNNTIRTSSQQIEICELLKENGYTVELNYPLSNVNLDVAIFIGDIKIDLEYDGSFWHQDDQKDRKRDEYLKSQGWKILRIKSRRMIPSLSDIEYAIEKLITTDRTFTKITLEDAV
jgi:very-short-patch-repair endonuclease